MFVWQRQDEGLWSDVEDCETFEWRMAEGAKAVRDPKPLASARDQQPKHAAARTGAGVVRRLEMYMAWHVFPIDCNCERRQSVGRQSVGDG